MKVIDIKDPRFLKKMKIRDLNNLSDDIREFIINNVSKTGGHLSSNLGVVDLTIALHKVFNSPKDKILFDVGHQCYTHKILTGRAKKFKDLRQSNGLSGFQKRSESEHDVFEAGHSSTSLSAALGFAIARDMNKKKHHVIAVIGDGSIANGLAYEAINHIGAEKSNLIIILNDNEMSISKNVGAIHNTLDKIRVNYSYNQAKKGTKQILNHIPFIGKPISKSIKTIKHTLKKIYSKDGFLFEEMGLQYFGPINGHDYYELINYLEMTKKINGPVLLHVITEKGKGYKYAEEDKEGHWHGVSPFDIETGKSLSKSDGKISWSQAISNHLIELNKIMKDIIVISPAMLNGSKLAKFKNEFPKNFIDVGIAEEHALVLASGLALNHKKPFVSIYSTFLQRGYDEVFHDIARMNLPVIIGIDRAGLADGDGETHQGIYDIAFLAHIPNLVIMAPMNNQEAGNMLFTAFQHNFTCAIRYSRANIEYSNLNYEEIEIGSWQELCSGNDATIITYGDFIDNAIEVRTRLKKDNIKIEIVNARFIKPFDKKKMELLLKKNKPIFVYEEVARIGSLGQMLCDYALENGLTNKIICLSIKDEFVVQGNREDVLKYLKLDSESIYKRIKIEIINELVKISTVC